MKELGNGKTRNFPIFAVALPGRDVSRETLAAVRHGGCAPIHPMKLLVFAGSTRQQSFNRRLARIAADLGCEAGAEATLLELSELDIPMYNADLEARGTPPDVIRLKEVMDAHPAWIICSPEYNGSYTGLLKNTIDWASSPVAGHPVWTDVTRPFAGKVVGVLSASNGALGGLRSQSHLAPMLVNLGCWLAPRNYALARAASAFDEHGQLTDAAQREQVRGVVEQVLWAARRLTD
jgi:NAD(P)H-dependent FMN reductase